MWPSWPHAGDLAVLLATSMDEQARKISSFHLSRLLPSGSKTEVHQGRFTQAGGVVQSAAAVVLKPRFACIGDELRSFLGEVGWATDLHSPIFPRVFEPGAHQGNYFLAMEIIDGWSLASVLASLAKLQFPLPCELGLSVAHRIQILELGGHNRWCHCVFRSPAGATTQRTWQGISRGADSHEVLRHPQPRRRRRLGYLGSLAQVRPHLECIGIFWLEVDRRVQGSARIAFLAKSV